METADKLAINELLAQSAFALDTKNLSDLEAGFTPDAHFTLDIEGVDEVSKFAGREAIMGLMRGALETQTDERRHVISNVHYQQASPDRATVVSYLTLMATENGVTQLITTGIYTDVVALHKGKWLIADRQLKLDRPY